MNKGEYLSFFNHPTDKQEKPQSKSTHCHRPKTSYYTINKTKKLLPHIIEEYQYRITNQLLNQKINHPKRDKIIAQSFSANKQQRQALSKKKVCRKGKQQKENKQQKKLNPNKPQGSHHLKRSNTSQIERLYKTFDDLNSTCNNYQNDYLISLQNNRMGKRLINTRSMVQDILTKTYYTYQIYNGKIVNRDRYLRINRNSVKFRSCNKNFGKINNGIKCFFQNIATEDGDKYRNQMSSTFNDSRKTIHNSSLGKSKDEKRQTNMNHHGFQINNPPILQTYGHGDLNLVINKLFIDSNPPLKNDAILQIQIIQKDQNLSRILNTYYAQKNNFVNSICSTEDAYQNYSKDCHTTASFPYEYISSDCPQSFGLKFRIHFRSHIYLRVIRAEGLEQRQVGVIRVSLQPFRKRVAKQFPFKVIKQLRHINGKDHYRDIFESECQGHLYRFKKGEISTTIRFSYQLYFSSFKPYQNEQSNLQQSITE